MKRLFGIALSLSFVHFAHASTGGFDLRSQVEEYKLRYGLRDTDSKLVDNHGDGYEDLYGVRNFRVVLHGVYYRGGANNAFNKNGKRSNTNPLPNEGLKHLCEQGFSDALYLYSDNFDTAKKSTSCKTVEGEPSKLTYSQKTALTASNEHDLLKIVFDHIKGTRTGPLYAHCWNGWHASGFVAAASLRQFCGWTASAADKYWVRNTDGNEAGMQAIRKRIKNFKPYSDLKISADEKALICP
jgi:hypothetical protein